MELNCSLKTVQEQPIPPNTWTIVTFELESGQPAPGWHQPGSGLIVPDQTGFGHLLAEIDWAPTTQIGYLPLDPPPWPVVRMPAGLVVKPRVTKMPYGSHEAQFARNGEKLRPDTTDTDEDANTSGRDFESLAWQGLIVAGTSYSVRVSHNDPGPRSVIGGELKLHIDGVADPS